MDKTKLGITISFIVTALSSIGNLILDLLSKLPGQKASALFTSFPQVKLVGNPASGSTTSQPCGKLGGIFIAVEFSTWRTKVVQPKIPLAEDLR